MAKQPTDTTKQEVAAPASLQYVEDALRGPRYGTVTITIHDGAIVQVERTEKKRLPPTPSPPS
jgi:hypothetical protein